MDLRKLSWLTICLPWLVTATGLPRSASTESLVAECNFVLGGLYFDLCPIIRAPTRTLHSSNRQYEFDLGERIREISNDKRHDCPDGTWICMTENEDPLHAVPIARRDDTHGAVASGSETKPVIVRFHEMESSHSLDDHTDASVSIHMSGGSHAGQPQEAYIGLICEPDGVESSGPEFLREYNGIHMFRWSTRHGCGRPIDDPAELVHTLANPSKKPKHDKEPENEDKDDEEKDSNGNNIHDTSPVSDRHKHSMISILILIGSVASIFWIVFSSMPPPFHRYIQSCIRPGGYRVGEIRLLQWAREDMPTLDEEEGTMVNSEEVFVIENEMIPLKPSPRRHFEAQYGSAPSTAKSEDLRM